MTEVRKPVVVMTATGRVKEHPPGSTIQEVLEMVHREHMTAGSEWDRPTRLFVGGKCIVEDKLTDIAWDFSEFYGKKCEELEVALSAWVETRISGKPKSEAP